MTPRQEISLNRVAALLKDARTILDGVMFASYPLTDDEFLKVRTCYDFICKASDKL